MGIEQSQRNLENRMRRIKQGHFYSVNSIRARGHKGEVTKKNKNGRIETVVITHAEFTRGQRNIPLEENPEQGKSDKAYIVREKEVVTANQLGKHHSNVKVKNKVDKSKIRHVGKK